jgi:putative FmdB family regulatory protein
MSLMDRIKGTLGGDDGTAPEFRYHCRECGEEFETEESSRSNVTCPECGASGTRTITKL